jgi:hypothetical protein
MSEPIVTDCAPRVGQVRRAETDTMTGQAVVIEITAIEQEFDDGWIVWGYRRYKTRARIRHTAFPRTYWVPK